jgi:N6-adenosine-specific RNA methylase IME4
MSSRESAGVSGVPSKFRTLLVDPPWDVLQRGGKGAEMHYSLMSLERIKAMPVGELAEADAFLWLWTTNATLRVGYEVAEAWEFTVRAPLTWIKFRLGLGHSLRNATEHLLFATRGNAKVLARNQPTWMVGPVQAHSWKPEEQFAVIERLCPGPYIELFARRRPPSNRAWFVWGNEVDSDLVLPGYPVPSDRRHGTGGGAM